MMSDYRPAGQQDFPIYPLKGMMRNAPPHLIPPGSFNTLKGYIPNQQGLFRRPGFGTYAAGDTTPHKMVDVATLWRTTGVQVSVLVTEDLVYKVTRLGGFTEIPWLYTTGTVTASGTSVTGTGMDWTGDGVLAGDFIAFASGATFTSNVEASAVTGSGGMTLQATLGTYAGTNYQVKRSLQSLRPRLADWAIHQDKLLLASYYQPLLEYDPSVDEELHKYVESAGQPSTGEFKANTVCSFGGRVWVGGLDDGSDGEKRTRIRWSKVTDADDFSETTAYTDLLYSAGEIRRIVVMGRILVVYLDDAIYFGTETNFPTAPVHFSKVETGGIGLVGPRAVAAFKGSHFFVGQDDVYMANSSGVAPLGCPVLKETIQQCEELWRVYAVIDTKNTRAVFGFPTDNEYLEKVWSFDYRTKQWSYDEYDSDMITSPGVSETITWDDLTGYTWDTIDTLGPSWDSFRDEPTVINFFTEFSNGLYQLSDNGATDSWRGGTAISGELETGDIDLGAPDELKQFSRLSVRIHSTNTYTSKIQWTAQVSVDGGNTWKGVGTLTIFAGREEGHINFRVKSSMIRIRLTTTSQVAPYYIDSMVLTATAAGKESRLGTQSVVPS